MLKYTPGSNSDGSNSRTQSTVRRAIFHAKRYDGSNQIFLYMNQSHAWFKFINISISAPWQSTCLSGLIWIHAVCEGHQQIKQTMQRITNCFVAYACDHTSVILKNACKHTFVNILLGSLDVRSYCPQPDVYAKSCICTWKIWIQWRPWTDAVLCGVCSGYALFEYVPQRGHYYGLRARKKIFIK